MRKYSIALIVLAVLLIFGSFQASAQTAYGFSAVQYNSTPRTVTGVSATWLDYYAGLYYDPEVIGDIYRTDDPETSLDSDRTIGYADIFPAVVHLETNNYVENKTYFTFSQHAVYGYYYYVSGGSTFWFDPFEYSFSEGSTPWGGLPFVYYWIIPRRYPLGFTEVCITIPPPPPTPTPTIDPCDSNSFVNCATPTPTPTPTPGPSPTVKLKEVGFIGDRPIRQLEVANNPYIEDPNADGTVTTWRSNDNPDYPVAYAKGTDLTVFAKLTITPALQTSQNVLLRIKKGNDIVTSSNTTVNLVNGEVTTPNVTIAFSNVEPAGQFIKKSKYKFTWEISFDNGTNWIELDKKSNHDVHWLNSNPADEANFKPFRNFGGDEFQGLYDKALDWSTGRIENNELNVNKIIQRINQKLAANVNYTPNVAPTGDHPLKIISSSGSHGAVCADNAFLLAGLLRSIGISDVEEQFHWGGDDSLKRNYFCPAGIGCGSTQQKPLGNRVTMQSKRDQLGPSPGENVEMDPAFTYHATVLHGTDRFDPSYGINQGIMDLQTALKVVSGQNPQCVHGAQATALLRTSNTFRDQSLGANNDPQTTCTLVRPLTTAAVDPRNIRLDSNGGSDTAVYRSYDSTWGVMDETGEMTTIPALEKLDPTDVLLAADYDGDGITDPTVWYANHGVSVRLSSANYFTFPWINNTLASDEIALTGDYDGNGTSDVAKWNGTTGLFSYWIYPFTRVDMYWGSASLGDIPVPGDYDGDGKTDFGVFRTSNGQWWIKKSSDGNAWVMNWGMAGDIPVPADYDGDGLTDFAIVRPSDGSWWFLNSESRYGASVYNGPIFSSDDWPVPADYNSDGKTDAAVWFKATGTWFIQDSQTGDVRYEILGRPEDKPVQSLSIHR